MPMAPPRACTCGRVLKAGERCPVCTPARDRARGSATARGYDYQWAAFSRRWLEARPWCGMRLDGAFHPEHSRCVQEGRRTRATLTDHIRALADGGAHCSPFNAQSLCAGCNVAKYHSDRRARDGR